MSERKLWVVLIPSILAFFLLDCSVFALDNKVTRETLRGLQGVKVVVEPLKWLIEQDGLTTKQLRKDTELKLRLAGIRAVSSEESPALPGNPSLYVNANVLKHKALNRYIFNIMVELSQDVSLNRTPKVKATAATWSVSVTGFTADVSTVRDQLKELVDAFVNAYLSVNPK